MSKKCCALNCNNNGNHLFPRDPKRRQQWEKALRIKNFKAGPHTKLCSEHFTESDYYGRSKYTDCEPLLKLLTRTAVPSVFCFNRDKKHTSAVTKRQQRLERRWQNKDPDDTSQSTSLQSSSNVIKTEPTVTLGPMVQFRSAPNNVSQIVRSPTALPINVPAKQPDDADSEVLKKTELYVEFRRLTELLVNNAATVNANGLKILIEKAQEMINIMNDYNEHKDTVTFTAIPKEVKNELCDDESPQPKKPGTPSSKIAEPLVFRKIKPKTGSIQINSQSTPAVRETLLMKKMKPIILMTAKIMKERAEMARLNSIKIKEGIGSASEKKAGIMQPPDPLCIDTFKDTRLARDTAVKRKPRAEDCSAQANGNKAVKTNIVKFEPSSENLSPISDPLSLTNTDINNVVKIEYEVKEQENDCNILVLKI